MTSQVLRSPGARLITCFAPHTARERKRKEWRMNELMNQSINQPINIFCSILSDLRTQPCFKQVQTLRNILPLMFLCLVVLTSVRSWKVFWARKNDAICLDTCLLMQSAMCNSCGSTGALEPGPFFSRSIGRGGAWISAGDCPRELLSAGHIIDGE